MKPSINHLLLTATLALAIPNAAHGDFTSLSPGSETLQVPVGWKTHELHRNDCVQWVITAENPEGYDNGIRIQYVEKNPDPNSLERIIATYTKVAKTNSKILKETTTQRPNGEELREIEVEAGNYHVGYYFLINPAKQQLATIVCGTLKNQWVATQPTFEATKKLSLEKIRNRFQGDPAPTVYFANRTLKEATVLTDACNNRWHFNLQPQLLAQNQTNYQPQQVRNLGLPPGLTTPDGKLFCGSLQITGILNKQGRLLCPLVTNRDPAAGLPPETLTNAIIRHWRYTPASLNGKPINQFIETTCSYGQASYQTSNVVLFQKEVDYGLQLDNNPAFFEEFAEYNRQVTAVLEAHHQQSTLKETLFINIIIQPGKKTRVWIQSDNSSPQAPLTAKLTALTAPAVQSPIAFGFIGTLNGGNALANQDPLGITRAWINQGATQIPFAPETIFKILANAK